jgi:hypothetical protein
MLGVLEAEARSLLAQVPQPLLEELTQGRWLPLVGAGFSRNARVPMGQPPSDWADLGRAVALDVPNLSYESPLDAISAYEYMFGRVALVRKIATLLRINDATPGAAHLAFARLGFERVVTTNFDLLLEKAYEAVARPCLPMLEEFQLSGHNPYLGPTLLKFHGDVHHPERMVMTEDDYDGFLNRHPLLATHLAALLIDHTGVLIGYSLDDPDTRQVLSLLRERLGRMTRPLWVLQVDAPAHLVSRYERRGVRVLNLPRAEGATYDSVLAELFSALRGYWQRELMQESQSTEERTLVELHLPSESSNTCYFAVPLDLIQWYREVFFPLVEEVGLVPVLARDVLTPEGTVTAKIDALIERAKLVVVDLSSPRSYYEAGLAMGAKGSDAVLFIATDADSVATDVRGRRYLVRPKDLTAPLEDVTSAFQSWLQANVVAREGRGPLRDAEQLLTIREARYALIAAVSELERQLKLLMHEQGERVPTSVMRLLRAALQREALTVEEFEELRSAVQHRNEALHNARPVGMDEARRAIDLVKRVTDRWAA